MSLDLNVPSGRLISPCCSKLFWRMITSTPVTLLSPHPLIYYFCLPSFSHFATTFTYLYPSFKSNAHRWCPNPASSSRLFWQSSWLQAGPVYVSSQRGTVAYGITPQVQRMQNVPLTLKRAWERIRILPLICPDSCIPRYLHSLSRARDRARALSLSCAHHRHMPMGAFTMKYSTRIVYNVLN